MISNLTRVMISHMASFLLTRNLIRHTLPPSPGVIRTLTWSDHQPSFLRLIITLHNCDQKLGLPHHSDLWTSTEHSQLSDPEPHHHVINTISEDAVLHLCSYLGYHAVYSTVWHKG